MGALLVRALVPDGDQQTDIDHYNVSLRIFEDTRTFRGHAELISRKAWRKNVRLSAKDLKIDRVTQDDQVLPFLVEDGQVEISIRYDSAPINIYYTGQSNAGIHIESDYVYTSFHTDRWLPSHFAPDDRATYRIALNVPSNWVAFGASVATRKQRVDEGNKKKARASPKRQTLFLSQINPKAPYVFGFVAGEFVTTTRTIDKVQFIAAAQRSAQDLSPLLRDIDSIYRFLRRAAGRNFDATTYTQVALPNAYPQEIDGVTVLPVKYLDDLRRTPGEDWLVVHELAHQWWGNSLTCARWDHYWLNEGFAVFFSAAYKEKRWGKSAYDRELELARSRLTHSLSTKKARPLVYTGWTTPEDMGGAQTYSRGFLFLDFLRSRVGDEAFWMGLRQYTNEHWNTSVETNDFKTAIEDAAHLSLTKEFEDWTSTPNPPELRK